MALVFSHLRVLPVVPLLFSVCSIKSASRHRYNCFFCVRIRFEVVRWKCPLLPQSVVCSRLGHRPQATRGEPSRAAQPAVPPWQYPHACSVESHP